MTTAADATELHHHDSLPLRARDRPRESHAIQRILVCVDRSPLSEGCLMHAVAIAGALGSEITLLHVLESPREGDGLHTPDVLDWELSRREARARLEQLRQEGLTAGARSIAIRLDQGHPAERITEVAREVDADLTVLAGHGERGPSAWSLGSTVQQVLSMTHRSVLIARSPRGPSREASPTRILVPLDGSLRTESVLPTAARLARAHDAELLLAFVVSEPTATAVLSADVLEQAQSLAEQLGKRGQGYLERVREQVARDGTAVRAIVRRSDDERLELLSLADTEQCDLIVLSAHGSACNPAATFGSVATYVLFHSMVSVLALQDLPDVAAPERDASRSAPPSRTRGLEPI